MTTAPNLLSELPRNSLRNRCGTNFPDGGKIHDMHRPCASELKVGKRNSGKRE